MNSTGCEHDFEPLEGDITGKRCTRCGAVWLEKKVGEELFGDFLEDAVWKDVELGGRSLGFSCPLGHGPLKKGRVGGIDLMFCRQCHGMLLERESAAHAAESLGGAEGVFGAALYMLSLPERFGRGLIGSMGGFVKEAAGVLIPGSFKKSHLYHISVEKMLRFVVEDIGHVKGRYKEREGAPLDDFVVRKVLGNAVEAAGLAVFHLSPVWGLALVSDCALGVRTYFDELVVELRKLGVIEEDDTIESVGDLLNSLEKVSGGIADTMDTPPISVKDLRDSVTRLQQEIKKVDVASVLNPAFVDSMWQEMRELAVRENLSLFKISSAVSMSVTDKIKKAGLGLYGSMQVGFNLLDSAVFDYYQDGFRQIREKGYWETVHDVYKPYADALQDTFKPSRLTFTEKLFSGWFLKKLFRRKKPRTGEGEKPV